jgi:hypothetical protein
LSMQEEVDTWPLIDRALRMKKRIFAPVIEKNFVMQFCELSSESKLIFNQYGLPEPQDGEIIEPRALDVVITPIVAFDDDGNRIGMGGGYFDRTFSFLNEWKKLRQTLGIYGFFASLTKRPETVFENYPPVCVTRIDSQMLALMQALSSSCISKMTIHLPFAAKKFANLRHFLRA